jgi:hypothetical protein
MSEMYCSACGMSFYKEGSKRGRMEQLFESHCKSNRHKLNVEKNRLELECHLQKMNNDNQREINSKLYMTMIIYQLYQKPFQQIMSF